MSEFYLGQIMMTGFGFAQKYFAQCNGQLLGIPQNQALFSIIGTTYGGNGVTNFALPDLRSRTPVGGFPSTDSQWQPPTYMPGERAGTETVTLLITELPQHTHMATMTEDPGVRPSPRGAGATLGAASPEGNIYGPPNAIVPLIGDPLSVTGNTQPHTNIQPYETINFNIALSGVFPSRS